MFSFLPVTTEVSGGCILIYYYFYVRVREGQSEWRVYR